MGSFVAVVKEHKGKVLTVLGVVVGLVVGAIITGKSEETVEVIENAEVVNVDYVAENEEC